MKTFLRLENVILPTDQIRSIATPTVGNESILEIGIFALTDVFKFDGQAAARVYEQVQSLKPSPAPAKVRNIVVSVDDVQVPFGLIGSLTIQDEIIPAIIVISGVAINTDTIEWVDLATDFNGQPGVELRLATDATGITKQYLGDDASAAYDILAALVPAAKATA